MVKVFESAPRETGDDGLAGTTPLPFQLPGDSYTYTAHPPKRAVWQRTMLANRSLVSGERKIAALLDFVAGCLKDPADRQRLEDRLLDGADALDLVDIFPVVTWLTASWSAQMRGEKVDGLEDDPVEIEAAPVASPADPVVIEGEPVEPATAEVPAVQPALPPVPPTA